MRIIIVRHAEPDYAKDSLTEKGWHEAELLSQRLAKLDVTDFYVSPLGRAQDTASLTLKKMDRTAETMEWLREFQTDIDRPDLGHRSTCAWDWMPKDWMSHPGYFDPDAWYEEPAMASGNVKEEYQRVIRNFEALLKKHGYARKGKYYEVVRENHDTIVLFCHFGVECVLLSRLLNVSPMILWHGFVAVPSSVTVIHSEERQQGTAVFRIAQFGDISHLYAGDEEPSFMARYCECYSDKTLH
jgi:probable phosphoglycerate mutase